MNKTTLGLSATGLILIAMLEGYSPTPYKDDAGISTNGFGNTHNVVSKVTVPQALDQLNHNVSDAGKAVDRCVHVQLNQNQYDALVAFTFNVGGGNFCSSTLVKKFNAGDSVGGCNELLRWDRAGGKVLAGLTARREKERQLCLTP